MQGQLRKMIAFKFTNCALFVVTKTTDGAISHRLNHLSLWADFVYMVPPFFVSVLRSQSDCTRNRTHTNTSRHSLGC